MVRAIIHHKVQDFDRWLPHFRAHDDVRRHYGCLEAKVRRSTSDPNDVYIDMDWDGKERFEEFVRRSDVRDVMKVAGVVGEPEIAVVTEPIPWKA